ncbi:helix-hairpin-helix domain-containing protein [Camelliibacillus cellulosilyticus]|uniref:Helix-hairpin-helix domain-containing protein n=1 Tax=Camelliibacillus cellulosilyticus TaxID=2174486 RepID=A0ABV9GKB3_9BACL
MGANPKLPLTPEEKAKLRNAKIRLRDIHTLSIYKLEEILGVTKERVRTIKGLAEFQTIPSIGYRLAQDLIQLNLCSIQEVRDKNGADLFDQLEKIQEVRIDPCVEDQFRCVVNFANDPNSNKQWFDFTDERKSYRKTFGYPEDRP